MYGIVILGVVYAKSNQEDLTAVKKKRLVAEYRTVLAFLEPSRGNQDS